ncbi:MAG: hypothetical protein RLZZ524_2983 [Pseudomonadota bacterium]|jgi:hypothetical protein
MPDLAEIDRLNADRRDYWQVRPDPLSHTAFARTLTIPDSEDEHGRQDPYDPRSHPGQWHFLQAIDGTVNGEPAPRRYRRFLLLTDAQGGGKSWLLQQIALHGTIELGQPVIWALPTKGLAGDMWNTKLRPAWEGSGLGVYLPTSGPGSRGSAAPRSIRTRRHEKRGGGTLVFMSSGGRGQAGQAGLTAKRLIVDELGDWDKAAFTRIRKRVSRFNDIAVEAYGSTLKLDNADLAQEIYRESCRASVEYRCPHCGGWTALDWKTWSAGQLACLACGAVLTDTDRRAMFATSRLMMADPMNDVFGIRLTALDCPWKTLEWLAGEESRAIASSEGKAGLPDHEPLRTFFHDERVEEYHGDESQDADARETPHTHRTLAARSEVTAWAPIVENADDGKLWSRYTATMSDDVEMAVAAIDVQRNRLYWTLIGIAKDRRTYDIGWGIERAHAGSGGQEPAPFAGGELAATLARTADWLAEIAGPKLVAGVVDVGDGVTQGEIASWLSAAPKGWSAIYGEDSLPAPRGDGTVVHLSSALAWDKRWRSGMGSYIVITDTIQQAVADAYRMDHLAPGAALLPGPLRAGNAYLRHLTGLGWSTTKAGRRTWGKLPGAGRADYFDCRAYATAVAVHLLNKPPPAADQPIDIPLLHLGGLRL